MLETQFSNYNTLWEMIIGDGQKLVAESKSYRENQHAGLKKDTNLSFFSS